MSSTAAILLNPNLSKSEVVELLELQRKLNAEIIDSYNRKLDSISCPKQKAEFAAQMLPVLMRGWMGF